MAAPQRKVYNYFEFAAATLYYQDIQLHLLLDEVDRGFTLPNLNFKDSRNLNFHEVWASLEETHKDIYRNLAKKSLYGTKEIHRKPLH